MTQEEQKSEIIKSRVGGFGGSDAKMFYKVGLNGIESLSNTDKKRIAVALGQMPYEETFTTEAMQAGNDFEKWLAENIYTEELGFKNNYKIVPSKLLSINFKIFAHADFYKNNEVIEAKYTTDGTAKTIKDYMAQLQWYYMLGVNEVNLVKGTQNTPFHAYASATINKRKNYINTLLTGIKLIDTFCDTFQYEAPEEWSLPDLLPDEQHALQQLTKYVQQIKLYEEEAEKYKEKLYQLLVDNNVKSLKNDNVTLSVVGESISNTFDKAKLLKDHPEIRESDYLKQSKRKGYLKINLK